MQRNSIDIDLGNPNETLIRVAGIEHELTILHITDSHLSEADEREEEAVIQVSKRLKQRNLDRGGICRKESLQESIQRSNEWKVDCTIFTGDILSFPSALNLELMEQQFNNLRSPYLYTLGNHDWYFPHLVSTDELRASVYPLFNKFTAGNPAQQSLDIGGIRLVTIDNSNYQVSETQLEFMKEQLADKVPTLLFFHIPLYVSTLAPAVLEVWKHPIMVHAPGWSLEGYRRFQAREADRSTKEFHHLLTSEAARHVAGLFCGHVHFSHRDEFNSGCYQYVTNPGYQRGYRKITIQPL